MCLGYDNGVILVYKHIDRNFCMVLPPPSTSSENITSFDVLEDGTKLVAGYFKGSICIFDLGNGKLVKKIENLLNSPIIFIKIINKTELYKGKLSLILGTWNDKIYRLKWYEKKILGLNTTKIKPIETLNYYFNIKQLLNIVPFVYKNTDGVSFKFLAVATFDKILVIDLKNLKQCPFEFKRPEFVEKQSLPYLFWEELGLLISKNCLKG